MIKRILLAYTFFCLFAFVNGQQWSDHFCYTSARFSGVWNNQYCVANDIGLFTYDPTDFVIGKISKVNRLNEVEITAVASQGGQLAVGYANGNIDILTVKENINIPDVKISALTSGKQINSFFYHEGLLYCCTQFGVVVVNIGKREVANTYYIGNETENYGVLSILIHGQFIYAATEKGLFRGDKNSAGLSYYKNWHRISNDASPFCGVFISNGRIVAIKGQKGGDVSVEAFENDVWRQTGTISRFYHMTSDADGDVLIAGNNGVARLTSDLKPELLFTQYTLAGNGIAVDALARHVSHGLQKGTMVVADSNLGMVICDSKGEGIDVMPNGPGSNHCFKVAAGPSGVYVAAGALSAQWNNTDTPLEFSCFNDGSWSSYRRRDNEPYRDLINIAINPSAPDNVYCSSWGSGVIKVNGNKLEQHYHQGNSALQNIPGHSSQYVRVGGLAFDRHSNLFMSNAEVNQGIVVKTPSNKWHRLSYQPINNLHSIGNFVFTRDNILWAAMPRVNRGLFVLSTNKTIDDASDDRYRSTLSKSEDRDVRNAGQLKIWDENREVITDFVFAICEDKNGQIWLGTDKGIVVYYRPSTILKDEFPIASRIKVPRNDGTNAADYLLGNEKITSIAVDGGNRKWIGTEESGVFLVSADGLETIHAFNKENSPLPSNAINSVAVHPVSGEVYIATSQGLVSLRGSATEPLERQGTNLMIYPNPVRENYTGVITIDGFSKDSEVVITDIAGRLVHKGISLGGRFVWNGINLSGHKVATGVYLILAVDDEGSQSVVGKFLVVK